MYSINKPNESKLDESKDSNDIIDIQWKDTRQIITEYDIKKFEDINDSKIPDTFGIYTKEAVAVQASGLLATAIAISFITPVNPIVGTIVGGIAIIGTEISALVVQIKTSDQNKPIKKEYNNLVYQYKKQSKLLNNESYKWIKLTKKCMKAEKEFKKLNFTFERWNINRKVILMIGPTGYGKSTVSNRLIGNTDDILDISQSDGCPFNVSNSGQIDPETSTLKKVTKKINIFKKGNVYETWEYELSVIDTPGAFDTKGNDKYFTDKNFQNIMKQYFNACGGINAFFIFFKYGNRWDANYTKLLNDYQTFWGKKMWKYCHIIITNCDKDSENARQRLLNGLGKAKQDIKRYLNKISGNACNDVNIYEFGEDNFRESIQNILLMLKDSNERYICDNIKSNINQLWDKQKNQEQLCWSIADDVQRMKKKIDNQRKLIDVLDQSLDDH